MDFTTSPDRVCFLIDNGSVRPAATLGLRRLAGALADRVGRPIVPVSLLHSDRVPASELDGIAAEVLEPALRRRHATGSRRFLLLPLFFGPSAALTTYVPDKVAELARTLGPLAVRIAAPLGGNDVATPDTRIAAMLADQVRQVVAARELRRPVVVMVDHGSPQSAVTALRDRVAQQLAAMLGEEAHQVIAASMERRPGAAYDFNEPLLARALSEPPCGNGAGDVVVAPLFFLPGRHAGRGGDIATILRTAEANQTGLRVHLAPLVGEHPQLIDVLADRYRDAIASPD